jgi:hypothetical protein
MAARCQPETNVGLSVVVVRALNPQVPPGQVSNYAESQI